MDRCRQMPSLVMALKWLLTVACNHRCEYQLFYFPPLKIIVQLKCVQCMPVRWKSENKSEGESNAQGKFWENRNFGIITIWRKVLTLFSHLPLHLIFLTLVLSLLIYLWNRYVKPAEWARCKYKNFGLFWTFAVI